MGFSFLMTKTNIAWNINTVNRLHERKGQLIYTVEEFVGLDIAVFSDMFGSKKKKMKIDIYFFELRENKIKTLAYKNKNNLFLSPSF